MRKFDSYEDMDTLTDAEALEIVSMAAERQLSMLHTYREGYGLDDRGDYLAAATDNYNRLFHAYWDNDGVSEPFVEAVKAFLKDKEDIGGSDGEIRFDLFTERFMEEEVYAT